jgi:hypothetical protein
MADDGSRFANSSTLSDVTIHYGDSGELRFEADKAVLSAKSRWFEAAFTGNFQVSPRARMC